MTALLWILAGLVLALAGFGLLLVLLARGALEVPVEVTIDRVRVPVRLRFGSKLPKFFRAGAITIGKRHPLICFRGYPPGYPVQVQGHYTTAGLCAHEVAHLVRWWRLGTPAYWREVLGDILCHPFDHDARPSEIFAILAAPAIAAGAFEGVDATGLLSVFRP